MVWPFGKHVSVRLTDDGSGFLYTVKYGVLRLPTRYIRLFETDEIPLGIGVPVQRSRTAAADRVEHDFGKQTGTSVPDKKE